MKYTAINIGPIVSTLGMARKPRELWTASYMFSYLMKCIYEEVENNKCEIVSPAKPGKEIMKKVGIYPDRIYFKGEIDSKHVLEEACRRFCNEWFGRVDEKFDYFNLMSVSCDKEHDSLAIAELNQKLDVIELWNFPTNDSTKSKIHKAIRENGDYPYQADLQEIARCQLKANKNQRERSHHRYICIVQADGDNVGTTVSHSALKDGSVAEISKALVDFGEKATKTIEEFGGIPVYAGGDDLLFVAPVIGKDDRHIFNLLDDIENKAFKGVHDIVEQLDLTDENGKIEASLSFGVSITYHKYPLYEALESARELLFDKAKKLKDKTSGIKQKKAIAWSLKKHSGSTFEGAFSRKDTDLKKQFDGLIAATTDDDLVSAVAHKIRKEEALVKIVMASGDEGRLDAFFEKVLEFDQNKKDYFNAVKRIMPTLYAKVGVGEKEFIQTLYGLLRTAKFIKGEDLRDE